MEDLRAGKYDGVIDNASDYFRKKEEQKRAEPKSPLLGAMADAEIVEGPRGRTVLRKLAFHAGHPTARAYRLFDDDPAATPIPGGGFHHLSKDFGEEDGEIEAEKICFLDTETTGLAGGTGTLAFLVGVGWWERLAAGGWQFRLEQYLIEDFCHECDMMERLAARLETFDAVCTYNGRTFDMPLLRTRALLQRIPPRVFPRRQIDLLPFCRRIWRETLPSVSLKNVELSILGIDRGPDLDGAQIPSIFFHMARTGKAGRMAAVVEHNAWDILTLSTLLRRTARIACDPMGCGLLSRAEEFAAVGRWFETRRLHEDAARAWTRALECSPRDAAEASHMARLALALKRLRRWDEAVDLWQSLSGGRSAESLSAYTELAKYYEHVARDYARALECVEECRRGLEVAAELESITGRTNGATARLALALNELEKREIRLRRKMARRSP